MPVHVRYVTDPACARSWGWEPTLRRLELEFEDSIQITYVMGGLARRYAPEAAATMPAEWLRVAEESGMPFDPRGWWEGPIASSYPACIAVKAASEQGRSAGARYLRALREGLMCFRRKLDTTEALVEEARRVRLDVERFRIDLASNASVEALGGDLEEARRVPDDAREAGAAVPDAAGGERVPLPSLVFVGDDGARRGVYGARVYDEVRDAARRAGAVGGTASPPAPLDALARFGPMATAELAAVCGRPEPLLMAELWSLAAQWRVRPVRVLTGELWEAA